MAATEHARTNRLRGWMLQGLSDMSKRPRVHVG